MAQDLLSEDQVRAMVRDWIGERSLAEAGSAIGVSAAWLCQIVTAKVRPCGKVLDEIGIARNPRGGGKKVLAFVRRLNN